MSYSIEVMPVIGTPKMFTIISAYSYYFPLINGGNDIAISFYIDKVKPTLTVIVRATPIGTKLT